ncbi:hypothetical protein Btru_074857 [Bulinus truncatus]|nr:hypothetical protein Btru_074857 [Bulinus truncatus]
MALNLLPAGTLCVICKRDFEGDETDKTRVTAKGVNTLKSYCDLWNNIELKDYLETNPDVIHVHEKCRRGFTNKRRYEQTCVKSDSSPTEVNQKAMKIKRK